MTKVSEAFKAFAQQTSVRGVPRVFNSNKPPIVRMLWLLGVLMCLNLLIWQVTVTVNKYLKYPYTSVIEHSDVSEMPTFPDVTICSLDNAGVSFFGPLRGSHGTDTTSNQEATDDYTAWYEALSASKSDFNLDQSMIMLCELKSWGKSLSMEHCTNKWTTYYDNYYYRCHTLSVGKSNSNIQSLSVLIYAHDAVQLPRSSWKSEVMATEAPVRVFACWPIYREACQI